VPFACNNDAHNVRVKDTETETIGNRHAWKIYLTPEVGGFSSISNEFSVNSGGKTVTADDLAKLRAEWILLNDLPPSTTALS